LEQFFKEIQFKKSKENQFKKILKKNNSKKFKSKTIQNIPKKNNSKKIQKKNNSKNSFLIFQRKYLAIDLFYLLLISIFFFYDLKNYKIFKTNSNLISTVNFFLIIFLFPFFFIFF